MKASLLLETIIISGLSMVAKEHGGILDTNQKVRAIINGVGIIETGLTQMFSIVEIKELAKKAIDARNLSAVIDITKEVASNLPGEYYQYTKFIKETLLEAGYVVEPLYLARDPDMIKKDHAVQHLARAQVMYRLRQSYVSISNTELSQEDRLKAVDIFISLLICNPHLQRCVIEMCLTFTVVDNHFNPLVPEARLVRLKHILTSMATDTLYDLEQEDKPPVVPPLNLVDDIPEENKYQAKPGPLLHFSGSEHLLAMKQEHGTLQEQLAVFHHLLNTKEDTEAVRYRNAVAYVHRSEYQNALCQLLMGTGGLELLNKMDDARLRAELVCSFIHEKIFSQVANTSIYSHPGRSQRVQVNPATGRVKSPTAQALAIADNFRQTSDKPDMTKELQELIRIFGSHGKLIPLNGMNLTKDPESAIKAIMAQLDFGNAANTVQANETAARVSAAGFDINPPKQEEQPTIKPVEISGGDATLRADIKKLFAGHGIPVKFTDEVPDLCVDEVHTYQVRCGGAIVALQYTPYNSLCTLTAVPREGNAVMQPLRWEAPSDHVPDIWVNIRAALSSREAFWEINRFLDSAGYTTY